MHYVERNKKRMTSDFSSETMQARNQDSDIIKTLKEKKTF
jgi:hypothetical protein